MKVRVSQQRWYGVYWACAESEDGTKQWFVDEDRERLKSMMERYVALLADTFQDRD